MRIVSVGKFEVDPADLEQWVAGEPPALQNRIHEEVESAWGFVIELDPGEQVTPGGIFHHSEKMGLQVAWKMCDLDGDVGFFLHGYRPGDSIVIDDQEAPVPAPMEIDIRLAVLYMPPAISPITIEKAWRCPKCSGQLFSSESMFVAKGWFRDHSNHELTGVTCGNCGYLEFYNIPLQQFQEQYLPGPDV